MTKQYDNGVKRGYAYAVEQWDRSPEFIAALVCREPTQKFWQHIQNWGDHHPVAYYYAGSFPVAYLNGFKAGMYQVLDERHANEWLTALPGYH